MSFEFVKEVISPEELLKAYPLPAKDVLRRRKESPKSGML